MRRPYILIGGVVVGVIIGLLIISGVAKFQDSSGFGDSQNLPESAINPEVGSPAPNFELVNLSGDSVRLEDYRGQVVLVNFWATWCGPCQLEMPAFQSRFEQFPDDLVILAVNANDNQEDAQAFMDELGLTFQTLLDTDGEVHRQYLVRGLPSSYFVDDAGIVRVAHIGIMTEGQLDDYLAEVGLNTN